MKFLHISDLHIGKRVHEFPMLEDQTYILSRILSVACEERADAVVIAGDIYDKPIPSVEAVRLFDGFLTGLSQRQILVCAISGNHDSPERIAFGARLMRGARVYVSPVYNGTVTKIAIQDAYGEVYIHLLPFLKPASVRHALEQESIQAAPENYQEAVEMAVSRMEADDRQRNVLVAHQFVTGAGRCESEEVVIGGLDNVDAGVFEAFDYVALGHIHSPQSIGRKTVRYCGTPLKYSFSEAGQEKSVTVVDMKEKGNVDVYTIPLAPLHDMRCIRGSYLEVTARSFYQETDTDDYIQITLTDEEDVPDAMAKLRVIYPNLMRLEYDNSRTKRSQTIEAVKELERKSELELFQEFYELQNNRPMSETQAEYVRQMIAGIVQP